MNYQKNYKVPMDPVAKWSIVIIGCIISLIMLSIVLRITGVPITYSKGERTGTIYKVSDARGWCWKTIECEMNLGGAISSGEKGLVANVWEFSVVDKELMNQLKKYSESGDKITVYYTEPWVQSWRQGGSGYLVTGLKTNTVTQ